MLCQVNLHAKTRPCDKVQYCVCHQTHSLFDAFVISVKQEVSPFYSLQFHPNVLLLSRSTLRPLHQLFVTSSPVPMTVLQPHSHI